MNELAQKDSLPVLASQERDNRSLLAWHMAIEVTKDGRLDPALPAGDVIFHHTEKGVEMYRVAEVPLRGLFRGDRVVQEFGGTPPDAYTPVFAFIERAMALYCASAGKPLRDEEFERLYGELRRRPDGRYQSPPYVFLQRTLRALLLLRPTSESEFNAIVQRLARSARTFAMGVTSTNYFDHALAPLLQVDE